MGGKDYNEGVDKGKLSNQGKCIVIINPICFRESLVYQPSLVVINQTIKVSFDFIYPSATYSRLTNRKSN
jgi:hypothetical protein